MFSAGGDAGAAGAALLRCGACREAAYCTIACQRAHWPAHKRLCAPAKAFRLAGRLVCTDAALNSLVKAEARGASTAGERRACAIDFANLATLEAFVARRGLGVPGVACCHLSPAYCERWRAAGDALRGGEDALAVESVTAAYVRAYDPRREAVLVLRLTLGGDLLARPFMVPFLAP